MVALLLVILLQQSTLQQSTLVHALHSGTFQEREGALEQILEIPPGERTEQLWLALAGELEHEQAIEHRRLDGFLATGKQPTSDDVPGEHYSGFVNQLSSAVAQWHDTRALAALISAADRGNQVLIPIVQFGEVAVAPLIAAARQSHFFEQDSVLSALQLLLEGRPVIAMPGGGTLANSGIVPAQLSPESKQQIRDLARDLLKPKAVEYFPTLARVANLALATGDPNLRQQVQVLVDLPSQLSDTTGVTDANQLLQAQNLIRATLAKHKQ
jgi:hypothetical protein